MDCCCRRQQSPLSENSSHRNITQSQSQTHKLKYSFRTQQATSYITSNTLTKSSQFQSTSPQVVSQVKHFHGMGSTVATNNELVELEREREILLNEDRQLNLFYERAIVPLERQVEYFQYEVKVRSIEIMELEDLLNQRLREKQQQVNKQQHSVIGQQVLQNFIPLQTNYPPQQQRGPQVITRQNSSQAILQPPQAHTIVIPPRNLQIIHSASNNNNGIIVRPGVQFVQQK